MIRRALTFGAIALAAPLALAGPGLVSAAPPASNPQVESFPVTCDDVEITVSATQRSSGATVFDEQGRVLVAKNFSGTVAGVLVLDPATDDETTVPIEVSFADRPKGIDPSRLIECTFTEDFTEPVTLDARTLEEFQLTDQPELLGRSGRFTGTFTGTVGALRPGRR